MTADSDKVIRPWIAWLIGSIWAGTTLAFLIFSHIHPATTADIAATTKKFAFRTNASRILGPSNEDQLAISGVSTLQIRFNQPQTIRSEGTTTRVTSLESAGDSFSSCSFYRIRSGGFDVHGPALITLETFDIHADSFSLKSHGVLSENLSSRAAEHGLKSGFECRGIRVNGAEPTDVEGSFSTGGGDSIFIATQLDARLDFSFSGEPEISDTQIPISSEIRFSEIYPGTSEEKGVLLKSAEIFFERVNKKVAVDTNDLLVIVPKADFYLRKFQVKEGIQVSLHGTVRNVLDGPGARDLTTLMPSAFEHADNSMRIYGTIPALVGLLLGILEKMGALGKK